MRCFWVVPNLGDIVEGSRKKVVEMGVKPVFGPYHKEEKAIEVFDQLMARFCTVPKVREMWKMVEMAAE